MIEHHLAHLSACASAAVEHPETFRPLVREVLQQQVSMRPLVLLAQRLETGTRLRYQRRIVTAFTAPLRQAQAGGLVRAGVVPGDLLLLIMMLHGVSDAGDAYRSIDLMLDGL